MPENAKKRALRERNWAKLQKRKFRPVTPAKRAAGCAPHGRKKGCGSAASVAVAAPAALAPLFSAPTPARAAAVDYSAWPCSCCGSAFGLGGMWLTVLDDEPRDWDLCVTCVSTLISVSEHLSGA